MRAPSRRQLLTATAAGLLVPGTWLHHAQVLAATPGAERRFLFVFATGGWDVSQALYPFFDNPIVDVAPDSVAAEAHGVPFVDAASRPAVRTFFEDYGDRTCLLHGFEVRSVAHQACTRILMTGSPAAGRDDWPALVAGHGSTSLTLPHVVVSGPSFADQFTSVVGRIGDSGQLQALVDGSALTQADLGPQAPSPTAAAELFAFAEARSQAFGARGAAARDWSAAAQLAHSQTGYLTQLAEDLDLSGGQDFADQTGLVLDLFAAGASRCGIAEHLGLTGTGWDTHSSNHQIQDVHHQALFTDLLALMDALASRQGSSGGSLLDETVVVVLSEMGRHPIQNGSGGKDHWTYTSAMLLGAGVRGGQAVGAYDQNVSGQALDLASGEASATGTVLQADHLGATLLALADVDPGDWLPGIDPVAAVLA